MDRPQWRYQYSRSARPFRWQDTPLRVQLIYRTLDVDVDDIDNFIRMNNEPIVLPNYREHLSSRQRYARRVAKEQAERVAARWQHVEQYLQLKDMHKRLRWAANDLEFVFEPYLHKLGFKSKQQLDQKRREERDKAEVERLVELQTKQQAEWQAAQLPLVSQQAPVQRVFRYVPVVLTPEQQRAEIAAAEYERRREVVDQLKAGALRKYANVMPDGYAKIATHVCADNQYGWVIMRTTDCGDRHCGRCDTAIEPTTVILPL